MINMWMIIMRNNYLETIEMASISFNPDRMEFLVSFTLEDMAKNKNEQETLNLGQAQILMNISHVKDSHVIKRLSQK